ncbi:hypothetical protein HDU98_009206 [Podochytrium sp. JEL0797]|nr:hypothetical protein HDU98_009206 [Podochytrium sp. JEL0797]
MDSAALFTAKLLSRLAPKKALRKATLPTTPLYGPSTHLPPRTLFAWGSGADGKLGHGTCDATTTPTPLAFLQGCEVRSLAVGAQHSAAVVVMDRPMGVLGKDGMKRVGVLFGWGSNFYGQAGFAAADQKSMGSSSFFADDSDDLDSVEVPARLKMLVPEGVELDMRKVVCGDYHSAALSAEGTVWTWGAGCLGRKEELYDSNAILVDFFAERKRRVVDVGAAGTLTVAVAEAGEGAKEVYVWGYFQDQEGNLRKSTTPLLMTDVLTFEAVEKVAVSADTVAVLGSMADGSSQVRLFGKCLCDFEMPGYPTFHEMKNAERFYSFEPVSTVTMGSVSAKDVKDLVVFRDVGYLVMNDGLVYQFLVRSVADKPSTRNVEIERMVFEREEPVDGISVNAFGLFVQYRSGRVVLYDFVKEGMKEATGWSINNLCSKVGGEVVLERGGRLVASGWDHALVYEDLVKKE